MTVILTNLSNTRQIIRFVTGLLCLFWAASSIAAAQQTKRQFTVAEDIQVTVFAGSSGVDEALLFSPDGDYFVVETEQGRPDINGQEDSLRFYRSQDVEKFLERSAGTVAPCPVWVVSRSADTGRIIKGWRWLPDSSGVAFLQNI